MFSTASKNDLSTALADLTGYLYQRYRAKVVMLVNEYDTPLINSFENWFNQRRPAFSSKGSDSRLRKPLIGFKCLPYSICSRIEGQHQRDGD